MTSRAEQVTCYPADAQYGTLLSDAQLERLGLSATDAAAAAEWARAYGELTDEQRAHLRAICHPFANGG